MIEKPLEVISLASGLANDVLLLKGQHQSYIFKWLRHSDALGLDRNDEYCLQSLLAQAGLAPEVIALDPGRWVLQQYISGNSLADISYSHEKKLRYTARALALIHRQQPAWQGTDLWQKLAKYVARLGAKEQLQLAYFRNDLKTTEQPVLCHFDLSFGHIIVQDTIRIIDWEYAGWGDPLTDIASAAEINQLDESSVEALCWYYSAETGLVFDKQRFELNRFFIRWINRQWQQLLQQEVSHE